MALTPDRFAYFRAIKGAVSLKQMGVGRNVAVYYHFRAIKGAVSLKPV